MQRFRKQGWRLLKDHAAVRYVLLLLAPLFSRPLDYMKRPGAPVHARLKGLWALPILVAGVWKTVMTSFYLWMHWRQGNTTVGEADNSELLKHFHVTESSVTWLMFAFVALGIYALALLRWGYHCCAVWTCRKAGFDCLMPPPLHFVVSTSAWGLWMGVLMAGINWTLWKGAGFDLGASLNDITNRNPMLILGALLAMTVALHLCTRNTNLGMLAIYAGSRWLYLAVSFVSFALLGTLALGMAYLTFP